MAPLLWIAFRGKWQLFADFKQRGFEMSTEEFGEVYTRTADVSQIQGETDLNDACTEAVLATVVGDSVLDAGSGRGYLARRLTEVAGHVVGCDLVDYPAAVDGQSLRFVRGSVEDLPFSDGEFDTVVCTHTLEHVQDLPAAMAELRRVARRRVIVVVPRERPYRYSFNLHLHFFPHSWNLQAVLGVVPGAQLRDLGDWFYVEDEVTATQP